MVDFAALNARLTGAVKTRLGELARVRPPTSAQREQWVVVDRDVELVGANGEFTGRRTVVSLAKVDGAVPQNTEIRLGADFSEVRYTDQALSDDGHFIKVAVR